MWAWTKTALSEGSRVQSCAPMGRSGDADEGVVYRRTAHAWARGMLVGAYL
jgi:hypothetical protein